MRENHFPHLLLGRKLRHDRQQRIRESVDDQTSFDALFKLIFHPEKAVAQRAVRAIINVVNDQPEFLQPHAQQLLTLLRSPDQKEIKSYVIQLLPHVDIVQPGLEEAWHILAYLALNQHEQKTIRMQALETLYALTRRQAVFTYELQDMLKILATELTPSIQAKVLKLQSLLAKNAVLVQKH